MNAPSQAQRKAAALAALSERYDLSTSAGASAALLFEGGLLDMQAPPAPEGGPAQLIVTVTIGEKAMRQVFDSTAMPDARMFESMLRDMIVTVLAAAHMERDGSTSETGS